MKLSIIIPAYNSADYIKECLDSIYQEESTSFEVIVVNDGSTDNTKYIVDEFLKSKSNLHYIEIKNSGQSIARNRGLELAKGEYVLYVDSDDLLINRAIEVIVDHVERFQIDILLFNGDAFYEEDDLALEHDFKYRRNLAHNDKFLDGTNMLYNMVKDGNFIAQPCLFVTKRKLLEENLFYPGIIHEDNLFTASLLLNNDIIVLSIKEYLYSRRVRIGSTMTSVKKSHHAYGYFVCAKELLKKKKQDSKGKYIINRLSSNWLREGLIISELAGDYKLNKEIKRYLIKTKIPLFIKISIYYYNLFFYIKKKISRLKK